MKRWIALLTCVALTSSVARADDAVPLKLSLSVGQSYKFTADQDTSNDITASFNGQSQPLKATSAQHRSGKVEILAVKDGQPTSLRVTYDRDCKSSTGLNGQDQDVPFPYSGKTVVLTRNDDGSASDDFQEKVSSDAINELHGLMEQNAAIFPKKAVTVGQEWPGDPAAVSRMLQLTDAKDQGGMTMKLLSVKDVDGRPTAQVKVSAAAVHHEGEIVVKAVMQGVATVDVKTGQVLKTDFKGTSEVQGTQNGPGPNGQNVAYTLEGKGTLTIGSTSPLSAAGAGPAPAVDNPFGDGGNPFGDGGGGGNPLAPKASPFVGRFTDGKLTLELAGAADQLTGTLELGGQTYPAKAAAKSDSSLQGTFMAGGKAYDFAAKLNGDTVVLSSGGANYTLKKAPSNPLASPRTDAHQTAPAGAPDGALLAPASPGFAAAQQTAATANPGLAGDQSVTCPAGCDVLTTVLHGQGWLAFQNGVTSAKAALKATAQQVAAAFGPSANVGNGYIDEKDVQGFAGFTATANGQPIVGKMVCVPATGSTFVAILFTAKDAPPQEWADLAAALPTVPAMHPVALPGNCGVICLPDGWSIKGGDATVGSVIVAGPEGESVLRAVFITFATPQNQVAQRIRNMPGSMAISPLLKPSDAVRFLIDTNGRAHPATASEILQMAVVPLPEPSGQAMPQQRSEFIAAKDRTNGVINRGMSWDQTWITGDGMTWTLALHGVSAPDATFVRKLPMLMEIFNSYTVDGEIVAENTGRALKQIVNNANLMRQRMDDNFAASQKIIAEKEKVRHDGAMDTIEVIRGTRTVEDTQTGEKKELPLGSIDQDVQNLNHNAGFDKFKATPLRDQ